MAGKPKSQQAYDDLLEGVKRGDTMFVTGLRKEAIYMWFFSHKLNHLVSVRVGEFDGEKGVFVSPAKNHDIRRPSPFKGIPRQQWSR